MLRLRTLLAIATCAVLLLPAAARAGALNLEGFKVTFPKASALCVKADKGKLGKKLAPSKGKVKAACRTLRTSYSSALNELNATVAPLRAQVHEITLAQRTACREARKDRKTFKQVCRGGAVEARAKLAPIRAQIAAADAKAKAAYEKARKTFWATIRKLKGGAGIAPDAAAGVTPVADVPQDTELDEG